MTRNHLYSYTSLRHRKAIICVGAQLINFRTILTASLFTACAVFSAEAQSLRNTTGPAEFPPADYAGAQYVDSNGCAFIRAGSVCGRVPTFSGGANRRTTSGPVVASAATTVMKYAATQPTAVSKRQVKLPAGFRLAWTDGRLSQTRGPRTAAGDAQMHKVWTNTVPRRLISQ
jgi:hypothetical protein